MPLRKRTWLTDLRLAWYPPGRPRDIPPKNSLWAAKLLHRAWDLGAQRSKKFEISIEIFNLDRNFWSRSKILISMSRFPHKNRAAVGGSLENFILDRNFQSRSKSRIFLIFGPSGEIWEPLVHVNFRGNLYGPIPWYLVFREKLYGPMPLKVRQRFP